MCFQKVKIFSSCNFMFWNFWNIILTQLFFSNFLLITKGISLGSFSNIMETTKGPQCSIRIPKVKSDCTWLEMWSDDFLNSLTGHCFCSFCSFKILVMQLEIINWRFPIAHLNVPKLVCLSLHLIFLNFDMHVLIIPLKKKIS